MDSTASLHASKNEPITDFQQVVDHSEALLGAPASQTGDKVTALRARMMECVADAKAKLSAAEGVVSRSIAQVVEFDRTCHTEWQVRTQFREAIEGEERLAEFVHHLDGAEPQQANLHKKLRPGQGKPIRDTFAPYRRLDILSRSFLI